jgi:putative membrane protein
MTLSVRASHSFAPGDTWIPAIASALAVLAVGGLVTASHDLGSQAVHMAVHIGLMNVTAPLLAVCLVFALQRPARIAALWFAAGIQIVLLWVWHSPALQQAGSHALSILMHGSLLAAALFFWWTLLRLRPVARWHGAAALLLTGKLTCLLGALLIFAPRLLIEIPPGHMALGLADQQLAGLLMVTACPLSYVVAGVAFAAQALFASGKPSRSFPAAT